MNTEFLVFKYLHPKAMFNKVDEIILQAKGSAFWVSNAQAERAENRSYRTDVLRKVSPLHLKQWMFRTWMCRGSHRASAS